MKKFLGLFLIVLYVGCSFAAAQISITQSTKPFAEFDSYLKKEQKGIISGDEKLVTLFNAERKRLGEDFAFEVVKYLGRDLEKHYWVSLYLEDKDFVQGNARLPDFSLRILQAAIDLIENEDVEDKSMSNVAIYATAAILSKKQKQAALAKQYKAKAEALLKKDDTYQGTFPALTEEDRAIYDGIKN
jgi:hypothetical protein